MIISRTSPFTGKINSLDLPVTTSQLKRWEEGELIQNVMANLTAGQREFIMTGITEEEWYKFFGDKGNE